MFGVPPRQGSLLFALAVLPLALACAVEPAPSGPDSARALEPAVGTQGAGCKDDPSAAAPGTCRCNGLLANVLGTDGDDTVGLTSGDVAVMGDGEDHVTFDDTSALPGTTICMGPGDDIVGVARGDFHFIDGEEGNDHIQSALPPIRAFGGAGNDLLEGHDEADHLYGGDGMDVLYGYGGSDLLKGGADNDSLWGGEGPDRLDGGAGDDRMFGEGGDDVLLGRGGSDLLDGGSGTDSLKP